MPVYCLGAYTQQQMVCRLPMSSFDQMPDKFYEFVHVEFTMPATTVSHAVVRSISVSSEEPPEKYVRYVARHEYRTEMLISFKENDVQLNSYDIPLATSATNDTCNMPVKSNDIAKQDKQNDQDEDDDDDDSE